MNKLVTLVLLISPVYGFANEDVSCVFHDSESNEMRPVEDCGVVNDDGLFWVDHTVLEKIGWGKYGLACLSVYNTKDSNGWYFITQSGKGRITSSSDNDCVPFAEGVAVGRLKGKVYFYNQIMNIVKKTEYTWSSGFRQGFAKVCLGELEKTYDSSGDRFQYNGGQCGFINKDFKEVIDVKYPYESTPEPLGLK